MARIALWSILVQLQSIMGRRPTVGAIRTAETILTEVGDSGCWNEEPRDLGPEASTLYPISCA
jgi:hypothetical protein